ncbi:MAG: type I 3-dehydroquinate dehydratase [Burkholderiales bacterium]|nr:type I 3-dehydroquinate dehydratase [Burkholderiales bacterium]
MTARPISISGRPLAGGRLPAVCAPLVGRTRDALLAECRVVAAKRPDLLEWRVDFFEGIVDVAAVLDAAAALRSAAGGIPLLFTRRSSREGGEAIAIGEAQVVAMYRAVCEARAADLVDFEASNDEADVRAVREASRGHGLGLVLSHHNFHFTPPAGELVARFVQAERLGADVAKVAVMPRSAEDVLCLFDATLQASRQLAIPVVSMSMAGLGAVSRLAGGVFGSALTFAVGREASAPGQVPIEDVRLVAEVLRRVSEG